VLKKTMTMENKYEQIEQYAKGELKDDDLNSFEQEMQSDSELAAEADFYQNVADAIEDKKENERIDAILDNINPLLEADFFLKELEKRDTIYTQPQAKVVGMSPRKRNSRLRMYSIAASFLVIVVAGCLIFSNTSYSNQSLAGNSYSDPGLSANLKSDNAATSPLEQGTNAYYTGDYLLAIKSFVTIPQGSDFYLEAQYNLAHTYYQLEDHNKAIDRFQYIIANSQDSKMRESADWYLALVYLAADQKNEQFDQLMNKMLTEENHRYHNFAKNLEISLNSFWRKFIFK